LLARNDQTNPLVNDVLRSWRKRLNASGISETAGKFNLVL
jgi:hypothetical protein